MRATFAASSHRTGQNKSAGAILLLLVAGLTLLASPTCLFAQGPTGPATNGTIVLSPRVMQDNGLYVKVFLNSRYKFNVAVVAENISPDMIVTNVQWELDLPDIEFWSIYRMDENGYACDNHMFSNTNDYFWPSAVSWPNYISGTNNNRTFRDLGYILPNQKQFQTGTLGIYMIRSNTNPPPRRTIGIKNARAFGPKGEIRAIGTSTWFDLVPSLDFYNYITNGLTLYDDWHRIDGKWVPTLAVVVSADPTCFSPYFLERAQLLQPPQWEKIAVSPPAGTTRSGYANFIHTDWSALTNQSGFYRASGTR